MSAPSLQGQKEDIISVSMPHKSFYYFVKCLLWITHKFTSEENNLVYLHVLLVLTRHTILWEWKQKKKKEITLYTSSNFQCNLTSGLGFIDLPLCKIPTSCEGKRTGCYCLLTAQPEPPKPLKSEIKLHLGYVSALSCTTPFLASLIISHLLARRNLEGMRGEREGAEGVLVKIWIQCLL